MDNDNKILLDVLLEDGTRIIASTSFMRPLGLTICAYAARGAKVTVTDTLIDGMCGHIRIDYNEHRTD